MKTNSKKLLLWLYPVKPGERRRVPYWQVPMILPDLTEAGRQSLIRVLADKQLLYSDDLAGYKRLSISSHGQSQLAADLPALRMQADDWQGEWTAVVFLQSPAADPSFRYLRSLLVKQQAFSLKRGLYLYPGQLPAVVNDTLHETYRKSVVVVKISDWQFGDEQIVIGQRTNFRDLIDVYSGISTEIESLLSKKVRVNSLSDQQKDKICSIFDRLYTSLETDLGLIPYYFPQVKTGLSLVNALKQGVVAAS
jgi:hypothetical protein